MTITQLSVQDRATTETVTVAPYAPYPPSVYGTSSSIISTGLGSKTFVTNQPMGLLPGARARATDIGLNTWLEGMVVSYSLATYSLTIDVDLTFGGGTYNSWTINVAGERGPPGATGAVGAGVSDGDKGDITLTAGGTSWTIDNKAVTPAKMADIASPRFIGRLTAGSGSPEHLTPAQATAVIDLFTSVLKGLVPPSGGGAVNYLRADGSWAVPAGGSASLSGQQCGRLTYVSATSLKFGPLNGDVIRINGADTLIPAAGIAGGANTGVFVNGVAGQNLAASTLYYVYAFNNSGTVTFDFSTTGHATSATAGNVGTEIKSGDNTRTLIGLIKTNASAQFDDSAALRHVASWFNRRLRFARGTFTVDRTTTSATYVELHPEIRTSFVTWGDAMMMSFTGCGSNSNAGANVFSCIGLDGTATLIGSSVIVQPANGQALNFAVAAWYAPSEGQHFITTIGHVSSTTGTWVFFPNESGFLTAGGMM